MNKGKYRKLCVRIAQFVNRNETRETIHVIHRSLSNHKKDPK